MENRPTPYYWIEIANFPEMSGNYVWMQKEKIYEHRTIEIEPEDYAADLREIRFENGRSRLVDMTPPSPRGHRVVDRNYLKDPNIVDAFKLRRRDTDLYLIFREQTPFDSSIDASRYHLQYSMARTVYWTIVHKSNPSEMVFSGNCAGRRQDIVTDHVKGTFWNGIDSHTGRCMCD